MIFIFRQFLLVAVATMAEEQRDDGDVDEEQSEEPRAVPKARASRHEVPHEMEILRCRRK